jgi:hypothetical protein
VVQPSWLPHKTQAGSLHHNFHPLTLEKNIMTVLAPPIPRKILSGRVLTGQAAVSRADNLAALARYGSAESVRNYVWNACDSGWEAMLVQLDERVVGGLRLAQRLGAPMQVIPLLPNVASIVREMTEYGLIGAGLRRVLRVGPMGLARVGMALAPSAHKVLAGDFAARLSVLLGLEMGEFARFSPPAVFLHNQMTDLALSLGNRALFETYAAFIRGKFGAEPGLLTSNFPVLTRSLEAWGIDISLIAAPVNREGFLMPGGTQPTLDALSSGRWHVVADRVAPQSPPPPEVLDWVLAQPGVVGALVELHDFISPSNSL